MTKKIICKNAIMTSCEPLKDGKITSRNFWNNKACVIRCKGGYTALQSYSTIVAVVYRGKFYRTWDGYSVTTMNHVNRFIHDMNIPGGGKAWWEKQPIYDTEIEPLETKYYKAIYAPYSGCYYYHGFKIVYPCTEKHDLFSDISVYPTTQGFECSIMINGYRKHCHYIGFTKEEAKARFYNEIVKKEVS